MQEEQQIREDRIFKLEDAVLVLLLILSLAGIGITDFSTHDGYGYWLIMVLVFGLSAIVIAWSKSKRDALFDFTTIAKEQFMHWFTSLCVVGGVFLLEQSGRFDEGSASLVILLVLSLSTILDGIRVGLRLSLVGLFLGVSSIIMAYLENFMWLEILIAVAIAVITIFWEIWMRRRAQNARD